MNIDGAVNNQCPKIRPNVGFNKAVLSVPLMSQFFFYHQNTGSIWNTTFIFERWKRSLAVLTHVKYKRDSQHIAGTYEGEISKWSFSNPHPRSHIWSNAVHFVMYYPVVVVYRFANTIKYPKGNRYQTRKLEALWTIKNMVRYYTGEISVLLRSEHIRHTCLLLSIIRSKWLI